MPQFAETWNPLSAAAYLGPAGVPAGSGYPTMSPIATVGSEGRPGFSLLDPDNPMVAFGIVLAITLAGFFAASYTGSVRVGPFKVGGSASAGKP